ncbi:SDR family oxidoreductase [Gammaproteobacteria bacterium]|nr:SDR family oxidoreductase [Gammaproteobacteria bacterium]
MPTVLITGANRGLGLELVRQYAVENWKVIATCRDPKSALELKKIRGNVTIFPLDVTDFSAVEETSEVLKAEKIDILLNNAGIYDRLKKGLGETDFDVWAKMLHVNTLAPLKIIESFMPQVTSSNKKVIVSISSLLGSIGSNDSGGQYAYRSSKAALNSVNKSLSIDLVRKGIVSIVISPGWVRTDMGGPEATVGPVESVAGIRTVIKGLKLEDNGKFFNFNGSHINW